MKQFLVFATVITYASSEAGYSYSPMMMNSGGYSNGPSNQKFMTIDSDYVPKVYKHVSVHSAKDEEPQQETRVIRVGGGGNKHVNVIFVKVPTQSSPPTEVILPDPDENKNLVYVLYQRNKPEDNIKVVRPEPKAPSKPEVHFIKYEGQDQVQPSPEYGPPAVPEPPRMPSGLYGTPMEDAAPQPQPPQMPSGLYGTPEKSPSPQQPMMLYGTPEISISEPSRVYGTPADVPPPPVQPSGFYETPKYS